MHDGDYWRLLTPGEYEVTVGAAGFEPQTKLVEVDSPAPGGGSHPHQEAARLDFELVPQELIEQAYQPPEEDEEEEEQEEEEEEGGGDEEEDVYYPQSVDQVRKSTKTLQERQTDESYSQLSNLDYLLDYDNSLGSENYNIPDYYY